jgi:glycosyltransferase involved in cell wall biosynthesis
MMLNYQRTAREDVERNGKTILLVINGTDFGGTERSLFQVAECLADRGYDVEVLSIKALGRLAETVRRRGIRIRTLNMQEEVTVLGLLWGSWRMRRMLHQGNYAIIHSFLPRANIMSRIANRCQVRRAPHVSSERSTDLRRSRVVRLLNRATSRWTDLVLAVTPKVRDLLIERDGIRAEKIAILENGIDLAAIDVQPRASVREELGLSLGSKLFCSAGRLIEDKGHVYLIRAFVSIAERNPMHHLVIVGDGPERAKLEGVVAELGLEGRVHFLGYRRDVISVLKDVEYFVLPSLEEGVPVAVLEAMACSLPVIATSVGGIPDVIEDEVTGLLVPAAEIWEEKREKDSPSNILASRKATVRRGIAGIENAMSRFCESDSLVRKLGTAGRLQVEAHYGMRKVISGLEDYYRQAAMLACNEVWKDPTNDLMC